MEVGTATLRGGSNATREFYSTKEIAGKLGVHPKTVCEWAKTAKGRKQLPPFTRFGGCPAILRFPIDAYEQWKEQILCTR